MATPVFKSGYNAGLKINSNALPLVRFTITMTSEECLFANSETNNVKVPEGTYLQYMVTGTMDYDFANDPFAAPYNIAPGAQLTNAVFYLAQTARGNYDGKTFTASNIFIVSCPINADTVANTTVGGSFQARCYGTIVLP